MINPEILQSIANYALIASGCSMFVIFLLLPQMVIAGTFAFRSLRKWLCYPYWSSMVEGYIWPHTAMLALSLSLGLTYPNLLIKRYGDKRFEVQKSVSKPLTRYLFVIAIINIMCCATLFISYPIFMLFNQKP